MESVLMTHPEEVSPFMVSAFTLLDAEGNTLYETQINHSGHCKIRLDEPIKTSSLLLKLTGGQSTPHAIFGIRVY